MTGPRHFIVVDAYEGVLEHLDDDPVRARHAVGLGLPLAEIAEALDCRITLLHWADWRAHERRGDAFHHWMPYPSTRSWRRDRPEPELPDFGPAVTARPVPATELADLSGQSYGILANSDPHFLASWLLNRHLEQLLADDPFALVILPMWGGLGYVAQLSAATGAGLAGIPFATVVTDTSANRQAANGEGLWTRPAITRRQMEDMSLGLADLALCFGERGAAIASAGRDDDRIVIAPRRVDPALLDAIAAASPPAFDRTLHFDLPLQPASGALALLDAVNLLRARNVALPGPLVCAGEEMLFAPQKPREFRSYWASRGWVKELDRERWWTWAEGREAGRAIRLCPTLFDHLPAHWHHLSGDGLTLLSPAAAEGLAPGVTLPLVLPEEPTPERLADQLATLLAMDDAALAAAQQAMRDAVLAAHRGPHRTARLKQSCDALATLLAAGPQARLDSVARLLLDRRKPLAEAAPMRPIPLDPARPLLTVAVMCFEMGALLTETIESVWASTRLPDELILVDDGSTGAETLDVIAALEHKAAIERLPLTVIRQGNRGLASARNAALAVAKGRYISFLDGDDLIEPGFYALALETLRRNPGLGGVAAWALTFGDGVPEGYWNAPQPELPLLLVENTLFVPCMVPTDLLRELGGYDVSQRYNYEDWEFGVRFLARGYPIVTIPRYLQRYRVRKESLLRTMSDVQNQVMRELMLDHHRETVARFAPEVVMQVEHRLQRLQLDHAAYVERHAVIEPILPAVRGVRALLRKFLNGGKP